MKETETTHGDQRLLSRTDLAAEILDHADAIAEALAGDTENRQHAELVRNIITKVSHDTEGHTEIGFALTASELTSVLNIITEAIKKAVFIDGNTDIESIAADIRMKIMVEGYELNASDLEE